MILQEANRLKLFEVKSGKALNDEFTKNMEKFRGIYADHLADSSVKGTVIYSGENFESFKSYSFMNFHKIDSLFRKTSKPFRLMF